MKVEKVISVLKQLKNENATDVVVAVDEEWNAWGEVEIEVDMETKKIVIYPINTFTPENK